MKLSQKLTKEKVSPFFDKWHELQLDIADSFKKHNGQAAELMKAGTQLYIELLAYCEHSIEPLNGKERMAFIQQNNGRYAAFRQLDELFEEVKKKLASKRIQLKREVSDK